MGFAHNIPNCGYQYRCDGNEREENPISCAMLIIEEKRQGNNQKTSLKNEEKKTTKIK